MKALLHFDEWESFHMELVIDNVGEALELNKLLPLECGFLGDEYPTLKLVS